jgi:outer membrane receptor protein involved in Fe transport
MDAKNILRVAARIAGIAATLSATVVWGIATAESPEATASTGAAADNVKSASDQLEEIVVTANKREESISKVGLTIKAMGGEALQQQHVTTLQDLANAVPSLSYTQTEQSSPVYTLRGVGFYDTSLASYPTVSVYLDQAPLPFPALTALTLFDLERVEVLKGPQGILFGNNATGGAINYIAAKPTRAFTAGGSLSFSRFSTKQEEGYISGPLTDRLLARASFSATQGDGYQISATRPGDRNGAPDTLAGRVLLDWRATDRLRFQANFNGWRDRTEPTAGQYVRYIPSFAPTPINGPFVPNATNDDREADWSADTPPRANNSLFQGILRADFDIIPDIVFTSLSSYVHYDQHQVPEGDGLAKHRQDILYNNGSINSLSQEFRIANSSSSVFRWLGGLNYSNDRVFEDDYVNFQDATTANNPLFTGWRGNAFYARQKMENYAAFANGEYTIGKFILKAGARHTEARRKTDNCVYSPFNPAVDGPDPEPGFFTFLSNLLTGANQPVPGQGQCFNVLPDTLLQGAYIAQLNQHNESWRVGVDWNASQDVLGYFNVAKGFKAGGFPTLSGTGTAFSPVTQESVLSYEGGIKSQLLDHRLSVNVAAFYYDYKNKQLKSKTIDPVFGPIDALVNIPKSSIKGAELELQVHPVNGLTLGGAATYLDATIDEFTGVAIDGRESNYAGARVPYTPKFQITGNANYKFPLSGTVQGFIGAQVIHRTAANSVIGGTDLFELPAHTLLDLQTGVDLAQGRYRVMLWGKNVTNEFYVTNVTSAVVDGVARYAGQPATFGVTVSASF